MWSEFKKSPNGSTVHSFLDDLWFYCYRCDRVVVIILQVKKIIPLKKSSKSIVLPVLAFCLKKVTIPPKSVSSREEMMID